jgi:adenylate cyclase
MEEKVAILMADLTGYTAMTDVHGGASAARVVNKYMQLVDYSLYGTTKVVQRIGDQVVMIATKPEDIVTTAKKINDLTLAEHQFLAIHAGIHFGTVFIDNGDLFGSTINITARIMNLASRGQILCSKQFVAEIPDPSLFKEIGYHKLKNVREEIEIFKLMPSSLSNALNIDPVCHMHVDVKKAKHTYTLHGATYHFCSGECKALFQKNPVSFLYEISQV